MRVWPDDWDERRRGVGCLACAEGRPDSIAVGRRFHAGATADAYLHDSSVVRGYALVFWRGRHLAEPTELSDGESCAFALEVRLVARAIEAVYRPAKLNLLTLGNSLPHLHTHIVPRYLDDPGPGGPPLFMLTETARPGDPAGYEGDLARLRAAVATLDP